MEAALFDEMEITKLFMQFSCIYGNAWNSLFKGDDSGKAAAFMRRIWQEGLREFSSIEIRRGLARCKKEYKLPPTLPQFVELCVGKPHDFGIPDFEEAFKIAINEIGKPKPQFKDKHPVIYHAVHDVVIFDLSIMRREEARKTFKKAYDNRVAMHMKHALTIPQDKAIEHHDANKKTVTVAEINTARQSLFAKMGLAWGEENVISDDFFDAKEVEQPQSSVDQCDKSKNNVFKIKK